MSGRRYLRCMFGPLNGHHVWLDNGVRHYECAVFPVRTLAQALGPDLSTPVAAIVQREIYVLTTILWKKEEIPVLVPAHYGEKELDAAIVESLFR
jgi:hypothetical protein